MMETKAAQSDKNNTQNQDRTMIFVSYAHEDSKWFDPGSLMPRLIQSLKRHNAEIWYDKGRIGGADIWRDEIENAIDQADIAILLVSQNFLNSDFIMKAELPRLVKRADEKKLIIFPILVGHCNWESIDPISRIQMMPGKPTPLVQYLESEAKWDRVQWEIFEALLRQIEKVRKKQEPDVRNTELTVFDQTMKPDLTRHTEEITVKQPDSKHKPPQKLQEAGSSENALMTEAPKTIIEEEEGTQHLPPGAQSPSIIQRRKIPTPIIDKVHFLVNSPDTVERGQSFIFYVWAHIEKQRIEVMKRIKESISKTDSRPIIQTKGPIDISRGTLLYVRVRFNDFKVEPEEDIIVWDGEIGNASFLISTPNELKEGTFVGWVTIHWEGGLQIARFPVQIKVKLKAKADLANTFQIRQIKKAFASYAHSDKDEVLGRIQGMQKILPDLKVFVDVLDLRSGEDWSKKLEQEIPQNDVFYLFWSESAKSSVWVEKEWRCALQTRGLDFIDPVPLVSPEIVQPPEELSQKHFNDWILAFKRGKQTTEPEVPDEKDRSPIVGVLIKDSTDTPESYNIEVVLRNGEVLKNVQMACGPRPGSRYVASVQYTTDLDVIRKAKYGPSSGRIISFDKIALIKFLEFNDEEKTVIAANSAYRNWVRKANVDFKDGNRLENVYILDICYLTTLYEKIELSKLDVDMMRFAKKQ